MPGIMLASGSKKMAAGGVGIAYVSGSSSNRVSANSTSCPSFDSTGATLLVAVVARFAGGSGYSFSDSEANAWTELTPTGGTDPATSIYYSLSPSTSSGHTATANGSAIYASFEVAAFSGVVSFASEQSAANNADQPGSVTPDTNGSLIICGFSGNSSGASAIDGGLTIASSSNAAATNYSTALAYLIQAIAASANPTWSGYSGNAKGALAAVFEP